LAALRGRGGFLHRLRAKLPSRRLATFVVEASSVGKHFMTQHRQLGAVMLVSCLIAVANMIVFGIILLGMGVTPPVAIGCALLVPAVLEISMLPISIAGWGLREGATVIAFGTLGVPIHQALGSSLAFGLLGVAVSLIGGGLWLADRRTMAAISLDGDRPNAA
ncbi:MAG: glycosyltransferase 2 family protein, partial [Hyphomicrobiales bacterium]|nr:glycosyltransferase 2 family protein [Hyphomicrobiales bacterium]